MESCHRQKRNYGGEKRAPERLVEEGSLHGGMWKDSLHGYDTLSGAMEYTCVQPCDTLFKSFEGKGSLESHQACLHGEWRPHDKSEAEVLQRENEQGSGGRGPRRSETIPKPPFPIPQAAKE